MEEQEKSWRRGRRRAAWTLMLNHVIVERFNWSGARSTQRWREDEITRKGGKNTRKTVGWSEGWGKGEQWFVRVATWIRRSRGRTHSRRGPSGEGGRCFCPTSNTFQDGNVLVRFLRNGHSTHSLGARARTHGPRIHKDRRVSAPIGADSYAVGGPTKRKRKRNKSLGREREKTGLRNRVVLLLRGGTKKLSYNCCTPRGASRVLPIIVDFFRVVCKTRAGTRVARHRPSENPSRPRPTSLSTDLLHLVRGSSEITVITGIYEGSWSIPSGLPL